MSSVLPQLFEGVIEQVLKTADPLHCLEPYLPENRSEKIHVVGAGKAAAKMAAALEANWTGEVEGLVITRYGHGYPTQQIKVIEAAHPVPDQAGQDAAQQIYDLASKLGPEDHLIVLISGGGSALMSLPIDGVSLAQKRLINQALLASGATIHEMNCVRKHLSKIKGGGLARAAFPAKLSAFAISDVAGDDPSVIASGPTVYDPRTIEDARAVLAKFDIAYEGVMEETLKEGDPVFELNSYHLIATPSQALLRAEHFIKDHGLACFVLGDDLEGDVQDIAEIHFKTIKNILSGQGPVKPPCVILSGGEATVTLSNKNGCGGPNGEFILRLLALLKDTKKVSAMAIDTDGIDGSEDNAGAWFDPSLSASPAEMMDAISNNVSYDFFKQRERLIKKGPTLTNINDFRAIYIEA